jgi:hypothetical protein
LDSIRSIQTAITGARCQATGHFDAPQINPFMNNNFLHVQSYHLLSDSPSVKGDIANLRKLVWLLFTLYCQAVITIEHTQSLLPLFNLEWGMLKCPHHLPYHLGYRDETKTEVSEKNCLCREYRIP